MPNSSNTDSHQLTVESLEPLLIKCSSLWTSTEQSKYSPLKSISTQSESSANDFNQVKQSEAQVQEQDSASTLSTCRSQYAVTNFARDDTTLKNLALYHGWDETHRKDAKCYLRPCLTSGNAELMLGQEQPNYIHSMDCIPYSWVESYIAGLVAAYGPNSLNYPQMMGLTPERVLIPLGQAESQPIYVNPKQFHAILRRRQVRAKLEAQNKFLKSRKPYLHESRHRHALKRPRGSGGRFLNTKNTEKSRSLSLKYFKDNPGHKFRKDGSSSEAQNSESGSWGTSTRSGSNVTSIFISNDIVFNQHETKFFESSSHVDLQAREDLMNLEAGNMHTLVIH